MTTAAEVVALARSLLGTPYQHQQRLPGVAMDCAGVIIHLGRALGLVPADFDVNGYSRDPDGSMLAYCEQHMTAIAQADMRPGDVIVVRFDQGPQHLGVLGDYRYGGLSIIHADSKRGVVETRLLLGSTPGAMKFAAAYRMPGIVA